MLSWRVGAAASGIALLLLPAGGAQAAQMQPGGYANKPFPPSTSTRADLDASVHIQKRLKDLRKEAIAQQKADGGALTEAHRAALTAKLEAVRRDACMVGRAGC